MKYTSISLVKYYSNNFILYIFYTSYDMHDISDSTVFTGLWNILAVKHK